MSSLSFLYFCLIGVSLILLLTAVSDAENYEDFTLSPDYDYSDNATFEYSFFSNTTDDLDQYLKPKDEQGEGTTTEVTTATTRTTTEPNQRVNVHSAASLPVNLDYRTLVWTLMILIGLNVQQLQHTL